MIRVFLIALLIAVAGCRSKPDTVAPVVLTQACEPVEIPVPVYRPPPADLLLPMAPETPEIVSPDEGVYGLSREGLEVIVDGFRRLRTRLARWRAWSAMEDRLDEQN